MDMSWYQQALTPPEVLEMRLRLGLVPERDHCQAQVDLVDPATGVLVASWSCPHGTVDRWHIVLDEAVAKARQYVGDAIEPF